MSTVKFVVKGPVVRLNALTLKTKCLYSGGGQSIHSRPVKEDSMRILFSGTTAFALGLAAFLMPSQAKDAQPQDDVLAQELE